MNSENFASSILISKDVSNIPYEPVINKYINKPLINVPNISHKRKILTNSTNADCLIAKINQFKIKQNEDKAYFNIVNGLRSTMDECHILLAPETKLIISEDEDDEDSNDQKYDFKPNYNN
jgi:hypothetical protein